MRKTILWILGILAVVVVLTKATDIANLFHTIAQGALIPIIIAAACEVGRYLIQSVGMAASFEAVGEKAEWKKMVPIVFSGVFINTIAPTGGTAGAVLLIDDANRRGISSGKATSAALVYTMGLYGGFILIMIIGFIILGFTRHLDPVSFICGMVMVVVVAFFGGILFICRKSPAMLLSIFKSIERLVAKIMRRFKRREPKPWAENLIVTAQDAANEIAKRPRGLITVLGISVLGSGLELLCFIMAGIAFGVTAINVLVAGYVVTYIFTVVSPSPNGVGIAEATAAVVLTGYGTPVSIATAVALVFRGFVFWIPFAVGALLLRRTGFFAKKQNETELAKAKQTGQLAGLFALVLGLANVFFAVLPSVPSSYELLSTWLNAGLALGSNLAVVLGIALMLLARGLMRRSRTSWAWGLVVLIFLAVAQVTSGHTIYPALALFAVVIWLFIKRDDFDQLLVHEGMRSTIVPLVYAVVLTLIYSVAGYYILAAQFPSEFGGLSPLVHAGQTLFPFFGVPQSANAHAQWFVGSVWTVAGVSLGWALVAIFFPWFRKKYRERKNAMAPVANELDLRLFEQGVLRHVDGFEVTPPQQRDETSGTKTPAFDPVRLLSSTVINPKSTASEESVEEVSTEADKS